MVNAVVGEAELCRCMARCRQEEEEEEPTRTRLDHSETEAASIKAVGIYSMMIPFNLQQHMHPVSILLGKDT